MEDVATPDGVAGDHGHDRLGNPSHEDLQVKHVEAPDPTLGDRVVTDVAVVSPDLLVAARTEGVRAFPTEDDDPHVGVVPGRVNASVSSNRVWGRKAFRRSGRQIVSFAMPSPTS